MADNSRPWRYGAILEWTVFQTQSNEYSPMYHAHMSSHEMLCSKLSCLMFLILPRHSRWRQAGGTHQESIRWLYGKTMFLLDPLRATGSGPKRKYRRVSSSAAVKLQKQYGSDVMRLLIILCGYYPHHETDQLLHLSKIGQDCNLSCRHQ